MVITESGIRLLTDLLVGACQQTNYCYCVREKPPPNKLSSLQTLPRLQWPVSNRSGDKHVRRVHTWPSTLILLAVPRLGSSQILSPTLTSSSPVAGRAGHRRTVASHQTSTPNCALHFTKATTASGQFPAYAINAQMPMIHLMYEDSVAW